MEDRVSKAIELFKEGYNCSQAVAAAFADLYGLSEEQMLRISASFGGGIGRMREICGAACGIFILAGLETGTVVGTDSIGKAHNYKVVQEITAIFKERNGSIKCSELLRLLKENKITYIPDARTEEYYKKRPCVKIVEESAKIWSEYLEKYRNEK